MARETRLLLLTLGVSVGVLFLLARFRFPERPISELAAPQPLARLARATTFDDLSATLGDFLQRAEEASVGLLVSQASGERLVPALRVRDDLALAVLTGDARVSAVEGEAAQASANLVVARDEVRGLVLVRVPARPVAALSIQPAGEALALPGFLVIVNASPDGPAVRAEFVSRATTHPHPAWDAPVIALGGLSDVRPGAMVFTLGGRFVGMVLPDDDETIVAPGDALIARADRLTRGESVLAANAGLAVQPLSPALAKATRADHGVIVAAIDTAGVGGPATSLRVGDVIAAIDTDDIRSVGDWERVLSHRAPGTTVTLRVVRRDSTSQVPLTLTWRNAMLAPGGVSVPSKRAQPGGGASAATLGLSLRAPADGAIGLDVVKVDPGSPAARAGLHAGDRLVALPAAATSTGTGAAATATSAQPPLTLTRVDAAFRALASGDAILLAISRAGQPLMVAVEKP